MKVKEAMMRSKTRKIVALVFAALLSAVAFADTETVNGVTWTYLISNGEATIRNGYSAAIPESTSGALIIPSTLGGCPVTTIGYYAFYNCSSLASVTIPDSVTTIVSRAFYYCSSLTSVTIPDSVTTIGDHAFDRCSSLISVTIPEGVRTIESYTFYGCSSLESVTIPKGVTTIGERAFSGCESLSSVTIPEGVTTIVESVFYNCSSLESVTIPKSVTTIGDSAFGYCSSLTSVTIPDSVRTIESSTFYYCSSLTSVTIPDSVTTIGSYAFSKCSSLTSVTISEGMTEIGRGVFSDCSSLTSVTIPEGVMTIVSRAFENCSSLASVTIPESVTRIGNYVFDGCTSLAIVYVDSGDTERVRELMRREGIDVEKMTFVEVEPPKPDGGPYKETVGSVEYTFFVSNGEATIRNGYSAAIPSSTSSALVIPSTLGGCPVTAIGDYAFRECNKITAVTIPASVTTITYCSFYAAEGIQNFTIAAANPNYLTNDGVIYTKDMKTLVSCPGAKRSVVVPSGVEMIGEGAFYYCSNLLSVTLPEELKEISDWAFAYCPSLAKLAIPSGMTTIGESAFSGDNDLASVTIPSSVTSVGSGAFWGCSALKTVHVEKGDTARIRSLMTGKGVDVNKLAFVEPPSRPAVVDGADESVKAAFDAWISRYGVTAPSAANVNAFILGLEPSATEEAIQKKVEEELANLDLGKLVEGNISAAVAEIQAKYPNAKVDLALVENLNTSAHLYKLVIKLK